MADQGSIGGTHARGQAAQVLDIFASSGYTALHALLDSAHSVRTMPTWGWALAQCPAVSVAGTLSGVVTETGTPVPDCVVYCYYRKNGNLVSATRTNASGEFTFTGLDTSDTSAYAVVALDPDGGTQYNALIFDRLTAV